MKLADLAAVQKAKNDLEYLGSIREALNGSTQAKMVVGGMHVRPDLASRVLPTIEATLDDETASIKAHLAALGVEA